MPSDSENQKFLLLCLKHSSSATINYSAVGQAIGLTAGAASKRMSRLRQAMENGKEGNAQSVEFLWLCIKNSDIGKIDWAAVGQGMSGLKPGAASKRYSRLKDALEKGKYAGAAAPKAAGGGPKSSSDTGKRKREESDAASDKNDDEEDEASTVRPSKIKKSHGSATAVGIKQESPSESVADSVAMAEPYKYTITKDNYDSRHNYYKDGMGHGYDYESDDDDNNGNDDGRGGYIDSPHPEAIRYDDDDDDDENEAIKPSRAESTGTGLTYPHKHNLTQTFASVRRESVSQGRSSHTSSGRGGYGRSENVEDYAAELGRVEPYEGMFGEGHFEKEEDEAEGDGESENEGEV